MLRLPPAAGQRPGHAWPQRDVEAIAALYADIAVHHSTPFQQPGLGRAGIRRYVRDNFLVEEDTECWFGPPIVSGGRAAVEWWASWAEQGQELTYAGVSVLRFDDHGQVVGHRDCDHHIERRQRTTPLRGTPALDRRHRKEAN